MVAQPSIARAASASSDARERFLAGALAVSLAVLPAAWYRAALAVPYSPQFFAAFGAALFLCAVFAAVLLIWRARLIGDAAAVRLAAAFSYSVPLIGVYTAGFPGVGWAWMWQREASGWAFVGWHIGWALLIVWYAYSPEHRGRLGQSQAFALGASAIVAGVALSGALPSLLGPTNAPAALDRVLYPVMIALDVVALIAVFRRRPMTSLDLWLCVSLVAMTASLMLSTMSPSRFSDVAQVSRLLTLAWSVIIVGALLREFAHLLERSSLVERFVTMAESAKTIVYLLDANGAVTYLNRRWSEVTGQPLDEALGEGWRASVHSGDLRKNAPARAQALATKTPYEVEQRYRQADGEYRWFLSAATPVFDVDGKLAWYGTATDIDAQRRALDDVAALYEREHRISKILQTAFLPAFLPEVEGVAFQAVYRPAVHESEVGGDWYDVFTLGDGRLALSIGDVFGHGLEAATAMVRLRETLRAVTGFGEPDAARVLRMADRAFTASHPDAIASAVFAIYDPATRVLSIASAGHPPPALLRDGNVTFFATGGPPLGVETNMTFVAETTLLEEGDTLALYTDGLTEVDRDPVAGEDRFADLLREHADDAERLVDGALSGRQRDDVALLLLSVVERTARPSWNFKSDDAASAADARAAFTAHLRRRNVAPQLVTVAELVFGELVGNVVRHAPGPIEVELSWRADLPLISVRDRGPAFEIGDIALPRDAFTEHGRGLYLVSRFASPPVVSPRSGGGNEVVVELGTADLNASTIAASAQVQGSALEYGP